MKALSYFDLGSPPLFIGKGESVDLSPLQEKLDSLSYSEKILPPNIIKRLIDHQELIEIIIPYHDSPGLEETLSSLISSALPGEIGVRVVVVASACSGKYINLARTSIGRLKKKNFIIELIIQTKAGKPLALNTAMESSKAEILIQFVDDVVCNKNALALLYLALRLNPDWGAAVVVGLPSWPKGKSLLTETQKIHHQNFYMNDQYALVGRAFSFRRKLIPNGFPVLIMSEDFWLEMQVREKTNGLMVVDHTWVYYCKPANLKDYLRQMGRYYGSFSQLAEEFPESFNKYFGDIRNSFSNMICPRKDINGFVNKMTFFMRMKYSLGAKFLYLLIIACQLYFFPFWFKLFPLKSALFYREKSTLLRKKL